MSAVPRKSLSPYRILGKLYLVAANSYKNQNFLGQRWIPFVLARLPKRHRRFAALTLLGVSPHYFIYQWGDKYPRQMSRADVLEAENRRAIESRERLVTTVLASFLKPDQTVLDFGCGPGWLAKQMSQKVRAVKGVDISCGVLACAEELNSAPNIEYIVNESARLAMIPDESIDLVVTFAVLQHLPDSLFQSFIAEFHRILRPGGKALCHLAVSSTANPGAADKPFSLLMVYRDGSHIQRVARDAGFNSIEISPARRWTNVNDDIANQHIAVLTKA
jgi:ubiquinone/menaquinone biosynthesis C-methylase UbiE